MLNIGLEVEHMGGYSSFAAAVRPMRKGSEITSSLLENIFLGGALLGSAILSQFAGNALHDAIV